MAATTAIDLTLTPTTPVTPTDTVSPAPEKIPERTFTIAQVAEQVGLTAHTLRYYERIGLLDIGRDASGRRQYTEDDVGRVVFITRLRAADLSISRIQHYFALVAAGPQTEPERLALLEQHREEIRARMASLEDALAAIEFKITVYGGSLTACTSTSVTSVSG